MPKRDASGAGHIEKMAHLLGWLIEQDVFRQSDLAEHLGISRNAVWQSWMPALIRAGLVQRVNARKYQSLVQRVEVLPPTAGRTAPRSDA